MILTFYDAFDDRSAQYAPQSPVCRDRDIVLRRLPQHDWRPNAATLEEAECCSDASLTI
jgi:hypothetical protein